MPIIDMPFGTNRTVEADYTQPDIKYTLIGTAGGNDPDTGDIYRGLDRFGRVKDSDWYDYGASADADRIKYGYDRVGNRTYRENTVATANSKAFDEVYLNDLIHRLKSMDRGTLDGPKTGVTGKQFAQCWTLDGTGNWRGFRQDDNGDSSWDLIQARTSNTVNEITEISETAGPAWVTPVYNRAGNMTTVPKPAAPTTAYTGTYDPWNRLVKVVDAPSGNTVAEYAYDGAKRQTVKKTYTSGVLSETRHLYWTDPSRWQPVEERVGASSSAERHYIWGVRYIDDLVGRDRDSNGDGTLDEKLTCLQDANWNVTAIVNTSGTVKERYAYDPYGTPTFLTATFGPRASSNLAWDMLYAGYRRDVATNLYSVRERFLSSLLGSWLTRDPLGLGAGISVYQYVSSNPILGVDPSGLAVPETNGCTGVPEHFLFHIGGWDFQSACDNHDICYGTCGTDKSACDRRFLKDMLAECLAANMSSSWSGFLYDSYSECKNLSYYVYYQGVTLLGQKYFDAAQKKACPCDYSNSVPEPIADSDFFYGSAY